MADRAINSLPTKTAPTSGDKMLMIGAAEEYQIDYDQLASAILDKLSTKQYSSLDTTAKTVLGALDELNGKRLFDLTYYDANTSRENIENRAAAIKHVCDNFTKNTTYAIFMIRYANGYYFNYIFTRTPSATNVVMEYTYYTPINMWREISSGWKIEKTFSDDATVLSKTGIELYGEQVIDAVPSTEYTTVGQINVKEGNNLIMVYAMFNHSRPIGLKLQTTSGADVAVVESNNLSITLSLFLHVDVDVTYNILLKCLSNSVDTNNVYTSILHLG